MYPNSQRQTQDIIFIFGWEQKEFIRYQIRTIWRMTHSFDMRAHVVIHGEG